MFYCGKGDKMNKRKRQIIQAARELFIKQGFGNTSIMDIIEAAKISKGTFYNHFSSKNECLIAILEESRDELTNARRELALNQNPSDINVLIDQISLIFHLSRKENFTQMFSTTFDSNDQEIKEVIEKHMIIEVDWLANRFIDIYGEKLRPISFECAIHSFAIMVFSLHLLNIATGSAPPPEKVVKVALNRIDTVIPILLETKDILFHEDIVQSLKSKISTAAVSKESLIEQLQGFVDQLSDKDSDRCIELANFLLVELKKNDEKLYVLESLLTSFNHAFNQTPHEKEAKEIANSLWQYLYSKKEKFNICTY